MAAQSGRWSHLAGRWSPKLIGLVLAGLIGCHRLVIQLSDGQLVSLVGAALVCCRFTLPRYCSGVVLTLDWSGIELISA